ncbi:MAG: glycosyltransferase, partial [Parasporobacterium sp.]|nr:glycosyltransferase [Parasporobacterium sp.]
DSMLGDVLGLDLCPAAAQITKDHAVNYMLGAVRYSDRLTTVSPSYAMEICTPEYGEGLEGVYNERKNILSGIVNGIDYDIWNPETDPSLWYKYNADSLELKRKNKEEFQKELGLEVNADIPLFGIVSRLTEQKGFDLVAADMPTFMDRNMQIVILGVGEYGFEEAFKWYSSTYPQKVSANITFSNDLSHKIYGCADAFIMPSRFEPCGLSQIMSMRYGTLPVVRLTGGLKDTVIPYNYVTGEGTGFGFDRYDADDLRASVDYALNVWYNDKDAWDNMVKQAMSTDFTWYKSAEEYRKLYRGLV